jgi:anti-sigma B factor antagonist
MLVAVEMQELDGWLVVMTLSGEVDAYVAPTLRDKVEAVLEGGAQWLLLDLTTVEYIDSVGLGIMVGAAKRATARGGDLAIVCSRANVLRVFEISGTKDLLNVVPTMEEGRERLEAGRRRAGGGEG